MSEHESFHDTLIRHTLDELEVFSRSIVAPHEEEQLLQQFERQVPQRFQTALIIGRFQPFHAGHLYLIKQALRVSRTVVVGIGSANVRDDDNPWGPLEREYLLRKALAREGLTDRVSSVVYINDHPDDAIWLKDATARTGEVDVIMGNNEWVNGIFQEAGYRVLPVPMFQRNMLEGKKIRAMLRSQGKLS